MASSRKFKEISTSDDMNISQNNNYDEGNRIFNVSITKKNIFNDSLYLKDSEEGVSLTPDEKEEYSIDSHEIELYRPYMSNSIHTLYNKDFPGKIDVLLKRESLGGVDAIPCNLFLFEDHYDKALTTLAKLMPFLKGKGFCAIGFEFDCEFDSDEIVTLIDMELTCINNAIDNIHITLEEQRQKIMGVLENSKIIYEKYLEIALAAEANNIKLFGFDHNMNQKRNISSLNPLTLEELFSEERESGMVSNLLLANKLYEGRPVIAIFGADHYRGIKKLFPQDRCRMVGVFSTPSKNFSDQDDVHRIILDEESTSKEADLCKALAIFCEPALGLCRKF